MLFNKVICDRCKQECRGSTYYMITFHAHDTNPTYDGRVSFETFSNNLVLKLNSYSVSNSKYYCSDCVKRIKRFMEGKE